MGIRKGPPSPKLPMGNRGNQKPEVDDLLKGLLLPWQNPKCNKENCVKRRV